MSSLLGFVLPGTQDNAVLILDQVLGHIEPMVGGTDGGPTLFSQMMMTFNHVLLGAGTILFAIMVFIGTMNTSNEGTLFGRQWNSMWTPLRLIFGLIFVVPLQSGFCIGQKIIIYAILIGISMGTTVWDAVVQDVFDNPSAPPIPSYMYNLVQQRVALEFVMDSAEQIYQKATGNTNLSGAIVNTTPQTLPLRPRSGASDSKQYAPSFVVSALQQQGNAICDNLYSGLNSACQQAVSQTLTSASTTAIVDPTTKATTYVNIGSGASGGKDNVFNNDSGFQITFSRGGNKHTTNTGVGVSANPNYSVAGFKLNNATNPGAGGMTADNAVTVVKSAIQYKINTNKSAQSPIGQQILKNIVTPYVMNSQICDPTKKDAQCNFQQYSNSFISELKKNLPSQMAPKTGTDAHQNATCIKYALYDSSNPHPTGPADGKRTCLVWKYNLTDYWIPSAIGSTPTADNHNSINLLQSWWVAGESYIILDNQLAAALRILYQDIQTQMGLSNDNAQNTVQTAYLIRNQISIWEMGQDSSTGQRGYNGTCMPIYVPNAGADNSYQNITNNSTATFAMGPFQSQALNADMDGYKFLSGLKDSKGDALNWQNSLKTPSGQPALYTVSPSPENSADNKNWLFASCLSDEARGSQVLTYNYWMLNSGIINPGQYPGPSGAGSGSDYTWPSLIGAFNDPKVCQGKVCATTYGLLKAVPPEYQFPIGIMLAKLMIQKNVDGKNYFDTVAPYLENMLNVLNANKILKNQTVQLPIKTSLDKIFEGLLGSQGGEFSDDSQSVAVGANSVLQDLYALGDDPSSPNVVGKQFSLIQQAQTVGISMIVVALNSISSIFNHFQSKLVSLEQNIQHTFNSNITGSIISNAVLGWIPFIGGMVSSTAQLSITAMQLQLQLQTISVMTAIGMSLAWLPIAAFVLISIFTTGIQFALLIPLMPYILFWAGQIAWLLGAIEGVVAAPIIMLGLATPGGHDFMGHTVPAVKMLLGVVFRPVLMVIGMVTGILLTYVVIHFSAQGFHTVLDLLLNNFANADQSAMGIMMLIATLTYGTFMVMAFTKCFSPIYQIPEKVMQWIGGQADRAGQEELQQVSGAVQQSSQKAGEAGQSGVSSAIDAQKGQAQQQQGAYQSGAQGIQQGMSSFHSGTRQAAEQGIAKMAGGAGE